MVLEADKSFSASDVSFPSLSLLLVSSTITEVLLDSALLPE
jgi:hypothetical protein